MQERQQLYLLVQGTLSFKQQQLWGESLNLAAKGLQTLHLGAKCFT